MTRYKKTRNLVKLIAHPLSAILDLPGVMVDHVYVPGFHPTDAFTEATTSCNYEYRKATMTWYLGRLAELGPDEIVLTVLHEYAHILTDPLSRDRHYPEVENKMFTELSELVTENVARALLGCLRWQADTKDA